MKKFNVTPTHTRGYKAPSLFELVDRGCKDPEDQAVKQAKERTRLSDFPEKWSFIAHKVY